MSTTKSSAAPRSRAYHRLSVNINGVTKSVLVPVTVAGDNQHTSSPAAVVAASATAPLTSPVLEPVLSTGEAVQQPATVAASDAQSPQGPSQLASGQLVALLNRSTTAPSRILQPEVQNLVRSVIGCPAESIRGVANQVVRPVLAPRMVRIINEAHAGHVQLATTSTVPAALRCSVSSAIGSRPPPTISGGAWKNRPTVVLTKTSPPRALRQIINTPVRPTPSAQSLVFQPVNKSFQIAPVIVTNAAIRPSSRPVLLVRPEVNSQPSIISNARSLTVEEAAAVGWFDAASVTSKPADISAAVEKGQMLTTPVSELRSTNTSSEYSVLAQTLPRDSFAVSTTTSGIGNSKQSPTVVHGEGDAEGLRDIMCIVDSETHMKVIEIYPDDMGDDTDGGSADVENDDAKQEVRPLADVATDVRASENCRMTDCVDDGQLPCSVERPSRHSTPVSSADSSRSDSVETTVASESERMMNAQEGTSDGHAEDFVVLAEWWDDKGKRRVADKKLNRKVYKRKAARGGRRKRQKTSFSNSRRRRGQQTVGRGEALASEPCGVQKARRTGGRPMTAAEKFGIVDCLVSAEQLRLPAGKQSVEAVDIRKYLCCFRQGKIAKNVASYGTMQTVITKTRIESKPQLITAVQPQCSAEKSGAARQQEAACDVTTVESRHALPSPVAGSSLTAADSKVAVIAPNSSVATSIRYATACGLRRGTTSGAALPTVPSSGVGGMPLLLHRVDGKPSAIVVARPVADSSQSKDKYLLIRTKTGAYLVPMDDGGTGTTASTVAGLLRSHRESCNAVVSGRLHQAAMPRFPGFNVTSNDGRRWTVVNVKPRAPTPTTRSSTICLQEPALMFIKQEKSPMSSTPLSPVRKQICADTADEVTQTRSTPVMATHEERAVDDDGPEFSHSSPLTPATDEQNVAPAAEASAAKSRVVAVSGAARSRKRKGGRRKYKQPVKTSTANSSWTPKMTATCDAIRSTDPHRERIASLKERLRQQEEQLMELKRQKMQHVTASE
jgi:hypothetical protein